MCDGLRNNLSALLRAQYNFIRCITHQQCQCMSRSKGSEDLAKKQIWWKVSPQSLWKLSWAHYVEKSSHQCSHKYGSIFLCLQMTFTLDTYSKRNSCIRSWWLATSVSWSRSQSTDSGLGKTLTSSRYLRLLSPSSACRPSMPRTIRVMYTRKHTSMLLKKENSPKNA